MIDVALIAFAGAGLLFGLSGMLLAKHTERAHQQHLAQHEADDRHRLHGEHRYSPNGARR